MKIKRFFAPDIRQAIRMVREEQGPDAVILSNRKVDGGVEIVAARDFDEQMLESKLKNFTAETEAPPSFNLPKGGRPVDRSSAPDNPARPVDNRLSAVAARPVAPAPQPARPVVTRPAAAEAREQQPSAQEFSAGEAKAENRTDFRLRKPEPEAADAGGQAARVQSVELDQLRREMREMKYLMNTRLSEFAWHAAADSNPVRIELLKRLSNCGFSRPVAFSLVDKLAHAEDLEVAWKQLYLQLKQVLPYYSDSILQQGGVVALVGPTGVGKTTTIAKLAARFRLMHGAREIALISTDNYRIAAHEQLTTYARILDVPVRAAHDAEGLRQALNYFVDKRLVLIDTAGIGPHDARLRQQFQVMQGINADLCTYLVVSATTQQQGLADVLDAFSGYQPVAAILTKLDEAAAPASAVSQLMERRMPLAFMTDGQQVPEDLHTESGYDLAAACLAPGDQAGIPGTKSGSFDYEQWVAYGYV